MSTASENPGPASGGAIGACGIRVLQAASGPDAQDHGAEVAACAQARANSAYSFDLTTGNVTVALKSAFGLHRE